jgi:hypothetical protein
MSELEKREEGREGKRAVNLQPAVAQAPKSFVRVVGGPYADKVVLFYSQLLYVLTITLAKNNMTTC